MLILKYFSFLFKVMIDSFNILLTAFLLVAFPILIHSKINSNPEPFAKVKCGNEYLNMTISMCVLDNSLYQFVENGFLIIYKQCLDNYQNNTLTLQNGYLTSLFKIDYDLPNMLLGVNYVSVRTQFYDRKLYRENILIGFDAFKGQRVEYFTTSSLTNSSMYLRIYDNYNDISGAFNIFSNGSGILIAGGNEKSYILGHNRLPAENERFYLLELLNHPWGLLQIVNYICFENKNEILFSTMKCSDEEISLKKAKQLLSSVLYSFVMGQNLHLVSKDKILIVDQQILTLHNYAFPYILLDLTNFFLNCLENNSKNINDYSQYLFANIKYICYLSFWLKLILIFLFLILYILKIIGLIFWLKYTRNLKLKN